MGLIKNFMNQTRKPEGKLGEMMIKGMNAGHGGLAPFYPEKLAKGIRKLCEKELP